MHEDIANKMLYKDFILNVDMIECIRRGNVNILFASSNGVLIKDNYSGIYMISVETLKIAEEVIQLIPVEAKMIVAHQKFYCKLIEERLSMKINMACYYSVWMKKSFIEVPKGLVNLRLLSKENIDSVVQSYSSMDVIDKKYIEERIESGNMLGAFINNNLCAFIGNHEEGSIGLLEVLEEYRGRGIGTILQAQATNMALRDGRIPYGEVKEGNEKSLRLQRKLGFEISKDKIYWFIK